LGLEGSCKKTEPESLQKRSKQETKERIWQLIPNEVVSERMRRETVKKKEPKKKRWKKTE
jgi:hypothetical protein